ncbi:MAG: hypothetical protein GX188_00900 [Syntrophomonadaceae bacterium]|nr:hypothetical protein [Thermoanaerobacterales bacterium]NLN20542.1 hypothetical protein [Syntrophomonadaceae bacterium]
MSDLLFYCDYGCRFIVPYHKKDSSRKAEKSNNFKERTVEVHGYQA